MILAAASSTAGIITASTAVFIALTGLIGAITAFIKVVKPLLDETKRQGEIADSTNHIVNSQRTAMQQHIETMGKVLQANNIEIPTDQSLVIPEGKPHG